MSAFETPETAYASCSNPFGQRKLVIAKPSFVAFWLRRGIVPNAGFVDDHPDDF